MRQNKEFGVSEVLMKNCLVLLHILVEPFATEVPSWEDILKMVHDHVPTPTPLYQMTKCQPCTKIKPNSKHRTPFLFIFLLNNCNLQIKVIICSTYQVMEITF